MNATRSRAIILGCGQVGVELAVRLAGSGIDVVVVDRDQDAFRHLPEEFTGTTVVGDGVAEETLRQAGVADAGVFVAATAEDNFNLMAAQMVKVKFGVPKIIVRVYDPDKAALFRELSLLVHCPTKETAIAMERMITGQGS